MGKRNVTQNIAHSMEERQLDAYFTPSEAITALTQKIIVPELIWEPSCGGGNISEELKRKSIIYSSDIHDYGYQYMNECKDFFDFTEAPLYKNPRTGKEEKFDCIFTNPPFYCINDYIRHAKSLCLKVIVFSKIQLLESIDRTDILEDGTFESMYIFRNRVPTMHRLGYTGKRNSSAMAFGWFVFNKNHDGSPAKFYRITCDYDKNKYKNI